MTVPMIIYISKYETRNIFITGFLILLWSREYMYLFSLCNNLRLNKFWIWKKSFLRRTIYRTPTQRNLLAMELNFRDVAILATIRFMSLDPKAYASSFIYSYRPWKGNFECVLTRSTLAMYLAYKVFGWQFRNSNKTNSQFNVPFYGPPRFPGYFLSHLVFELLLFHFTKYF